MFGISFWELLLIGLVALLVVGPEKLPKMLGTLGRWSNKLRRITTEVRHQTGIDDMLRQNGIKGGLDEIRELRNIVKGNVAGLANAATAPRAAAPLGATSATPTPALRTAGSTQSQAPPLRTLDDVYADIPADRSREYPDEGCDSYGCLSDSLWSDVNREAFDEETTAIHSQSPDPGYPEEPSDSDEQASPSDAEAEQPGEASAAFPADSSEGEPAVSAPAAGSSPNSEAVGDEKTGADGSDIQSESEPSSASSSTPG